MQNEERSKWIESRRLDLEQDIIGHIISDNQACIDFLCFMDNEEPNALCKFLEEWLSTPDGKKWFDKTFQRMIENEPKCESDL